MGKVRLIVTSGTPSSSKVYNHIIGTITRAVDGPRTIRESLSPGPLSLHLPLLVPLLVLLSLDTILSSAAALPSTPLAAKLTRPSPPSEQAATAREVFEVSPASQGRFSLKSYSLNNSDRPSSSSTSSSDDTITTIDLPWDLPPPSARTFFLVDRFSDASVILYTSNDVIVNASKVSLSALYHPDRETYLTRSTPAARQAVLLRHQALGPRTRSPVDRLGERMESGAVQREAQRRAWLYAVLGPQSGFIFQCSPSTRLIKSSQIPDLPPKGELYPRGTDVSERSMAGQKFILVEAIFTASSDALTCVITRLDKESE
ncbi:hypothetical protein P7C73_g6385, partial [Tremellales sp. Uapishka_1]